MKSTDPKSPKRLIADFVVIVVGVLVALGVDSYVTWRNDRFLEAEYLERLLEDTRYDLSELAFVDDVSMAALAYLDTLSNPVAVRDLDPSRLAGAILIASASRQADLSRSTFDELVSSGRIGLMRSREVRTALAEYHRVIKEFAGFWEQVDTRFQDWALTRFSYTEFEFVKTSCGEHTMERDDLVTTACSFPWSGRSLETLREEVGSAQVQGLVRYQTTRVGGSHNIVQVLRDAVRSLRETLTTELEAVSGG